MTAWSTAVTEMPSEGDLQLYQRPHFWAGVVGSCFRSSEYSVLVSDHARKTAIISRSGSSSAFCCLIYGVLILGAGLMDMSAAGRRTVVLAELHAQIWWGVLLLVIGAVYTLKFRPGDGSHMMN